MSKRVYLSKNDARLTRWQGIPVRIRIQHRCVSVKDFDNHRAGCEFSRVLTLLTLAIVEAKSGSRVWCRQKNTHIPLDSYEEKSLSDRGIHDKDRGSPAPAAHAILG